MKRCEVLECGQLINEHGKRVQLRDRLFCSSGCANFWLAGQGIRIVSDNDKPKLPIVYVKQRT